MSQRETRDFMSINSFSQLPFIRPAPAKEKQVASSAGIRLFGFDVPQEPDGRSSRDVAPKDSTNDSNNNHKGSGAGSGGSESGRKFECHYCCRNFPTSQALGGHQNAHKRERQHAKRVHFQSALTAHHHHRHHTGIGDGYGYGLLGYHQLSSVPFAARFGNGHAFEASPPPLYPSLNSASNPTGPRFHGGLGSVSQPINGSPLPGVWRMPSSMQGSTASIGIIHRDRSMPLPLFAGHDSRVMGMGIGGSGGSVGSSSSSSSSSTPPPHPHGPMHGVKDSVSLDLHL